MADTLTEAIFDKLVEAHTLKEAGDHDGARTVMEELRDELGVEGFGGFGHGDRGPRGSGDQTED